MMIVDMSMQSVYPCSPLGLPKRKNAALDFDLPSQFNGAGNRELEKFCWPLRMLGHGNKEAFTPTHHPWLLRRDDGLATEKKTRLLLLDHKVFQSARLLYGCAARDKRAGVYMKNTIGRPSI